ncbi:putative sucrose-phosphate synthase 4, partial [Cucurbita argyrosperma subsp. sororia]
MQFNSGKYASTDANMPVGTLKALKGCQLGLQEFDTLVCNSGSELYYPCQDTAADTDYESHIDYRWAAENVSSTVTRLAKSEGGNKDDITEHLGV